MLKLTLVAVVAHLLVAATLRAQSDDSVYSGRRCNKRLRELRMPLLAELGDSVHLADLLSRGADPRASITSVQFTFGKDGALRRVEVRDAQSSAAGTLIKDSMRAVVTPQSAYPRDFRVYLVRFNSTGQLRLLAETATCEPENHLTAAARALIEEIHRTAPATHVHRGAVVRFVLEADGQVSDAWLEVRTGYTQVDSLAMEIFHLLRFDPAIVGRTPVAALVQQPLKF